ncbi:MAG: hypothetical protein FJX03_06510 [Alphaproteobacteria bacterium]|nr:hypothetical protein [Alphaproteobacteria bacterium]
MKFSQFKFLAMAMSCMVIAFCSGTYSADDKIERKESSQITALRTSHLTGEKASINDSLVSQDGAKPATYSTYLGNAYYAGKVVASSLYNLIDFSVNNPGKALTIALAASTPFAAANTNLQVESICSLWNQNNCDKCACYCSTFNLREGMGLNGVPYDASPQMGNVYNWFVVEPIGFFPGSGACETACSERNNVIKGCYEFKECTQFKKTDQYKEFRAQIDCKKNTNSHHKTDVKSD